MLRLNRHRFCPFAAIAPAVVLLFGVIFMNISLGESLAGKDPSPADVFTARLTGLLRISGSAEGETQFKKMEKIRAQFTAFPGEFPDSVFADDAGFVSCLIEFMGAVLVPPRDLQGAREMIILMDNIVRTYPSGSLEPLTVEILEGEFGRESLNGSFMIPYRLIVDYMRAMYSGQTRDYKNAARLYGKLKDELSPITDERVAVGIYAPLYVAYRQTDFSAEARALEKEASELYPDSQLVSILAQLRQEGQN